VTRDVLRRLMAAVSAAMTPTPSGMANQIDIVCSLPELEHAVASKRPTHAVREGAEGNAREAPLIIPVLTILMPSCMGKGWA
jgi:hypothetical protein